MKKALTMRKGRVGTGGPTVKVTQLTDNTRSSRKHLSMRNSSTFKNIQSVASKSESLLLLGDPEFAVNQGEKKEARLHHYDYFEGKTELEEISIRSNVEVRSQKFGGGGGSIRGSIRASLRPAKREAGELVLGDGRIQFNLKSGKNHVYEVSQIESLVLKTLKSKEFGVKFFKDSRIFSIKCETALIAQELVKYIFIEARALSLVLSKCLTQILPEDWIEALQTSSKLKEGPDAKMLTVMEPNEKNAAEICIREMVDLIAFSRGDDNMEYFEICETFSKWLIKNGKGEEARFWEEIVEKGHSRHEERRKKELDGDGTFLGKKINERNNAIEEIRNPVQLSQVADMRARATPKNLQSRVKRVQENLMKIAENIDKSGDQYESLI